ncbi:MAG: transglutaminase-like domain-containing protein, partial [Candidatus Hermodarchaeia archaeon]
NNLSYISDQAGRDYWCTPRETLTRGGGDCEDFSILFSSMMGVLGGTTRIYLTETHAFSVLFCGNETQKNDILGAVEDYYGTQPNFVVFEDETGHWLTADPAGSLYLGGLPADSVPSTNSGFNFFNTTEIHIVDIVD